MRKGLVVDLDGSLMNTNTFQKYIVFIIKEAALVCRFDIVITLLHYAREDEVSYIGKDLFFYEFSTS
mgnify:CR=1 FL=1